MQLVNKHGLHARPISEFVKLVGRYRARVLVEGPGGQADGGSVLQMMGLAAAHGSELRIHAEGDDAADALAALEALVLRGFGET